MKAVFTGPVSCDKVTIPASPVFMFILKSRMSQKGSPLVRIDKSELVKLSGFAFKHREKPGRNVAGLFVLLKTHNKTVGADYSYGSLSR